MSATILTSVNSRRYIFVVFPLSPSLSSVSNIVLYLHNNYTDIFSYLIAFHVMFLGAGAAADVVRRLQLDIHCGGVLQRRATNLSGKHRCLLPPIYARW